MEVSDAIGLHTFPNTGRGVGAKRAIYKGEVILKIKNVITARFIIEKCQDMVFMYKTMRFGPEFKTSNHI